MIYLDTSVALAALLTEERRPAPAFWDRPLVSSRLLEYELWTRLHARRLAGSHGEAARQILARVSFVELLPPVLARALEPFPLPVRTLDALHLATALYVATAGQEVVLATLDDRMRQAARSLRLRLEG
jgi:predicted nucleic acid-binding protein